MLNEEGPCPDRACNAFYLVLDSIETADSAWLHVAELLAPALGGSMELELSITLAMALPQGTPRVLRILVTDRGPGPLKIAEVCRVPLIAPTRAELESYLRRTREGLAQVTDPTLRAKRDLCSRWIDRGVRNVVIEE